MVSTLSEVLGESAERVHAILSSLEEKPEAAPELPPPPSQKALPPVREPEEPSWQAASRLEAYLRKRGVPAADCIEIAHGTSRTYWHTEVTPRSTQTRMLRGPLTAKLFREMQFYRRDQFMYEESHVLTIPYTLTWK